MAQMKYVCCFILVPILIATLMFLQPLGRLEHSSLTSSVRIDRDENGAPHIYASSLEDALFAYGYSVAEDRLWQMDVSRRLPKGRLSELLGERPLELDIFMRNIRLGYHAERSIADLNPEALKLVEKYAEGVNYYAKTHILPIEYWLTWSSFEDWQPSDSQAVLLMVGISVNTNWGHELLNFKLQSLLGILGNELINDDLNNIRKLFPIVSEVPEEIQGPAIPVFQNSFANVSAIPEMPYVSENGGSNAWVVNGELTESGLPILASDPHLTGIIPSYWYFVGIYLDDGNFIQGITAAGMIVFQSARNKNMAWATTSARIDGIDIFLEKIDGNRALYDEEWYDLQSFNETVYVKNKDPFEIQFRESKNGPIVDKRFLKGGFLINKLYTALEADYSIRAFYAHVKLTSLDLILFCHKEESIHTFKANSGTNTFGYLTFLVANTAGDILFANSGQVPIRKTNGKFPTPGWTSDYSWAGFYPHSESPYAINPSQKFLVSTNNFQVLNYKHLEEMGGTFLEGRSERITEMLTEQIKSGKKFRSEDMMKIQTDTLDVLARDSVPIMLSLLPKDTLVEEQKALKNWNFRADIESHAAALFYSWMSNISRRILSDKIEDESLVKDTMNSFLHNNFVYRMFNDTRYSHWCDKKATVSIETCSELLAESLAAASSEVGTRVWGDMHILHLKHPFSAVPYIGRIFDREIRTSGSGVTPYAVTHFWGTGYKGYYGPNMRLIVDLAGDSYYILETGVSGNIFSSHYSDMLEDFHNGKYKKLTIGDHQIQKSTQINSVANN